jgi:hypothetical protein
MSIRDQAKLCFQKGKFSAAADACACPTSYSVLFPSPVFLVLAALVSACSHPSTRLSCITLCPACDGIRSTLFLTLHPFFRVD